MNQVKTNLIVILGVWIFSFEARAQQLSSPKTLQALEQIRDRWSSVDSAKNRKQSAEILERAGLSLSALLYGENLIQRMLADAQDIERYSEKIIEFGLYPRLDALEIRIKKSLANKKQNPPQLYRYAQGLSLIEKERYSEARAFLNPQDRWGKISDQAKYQLLRGQAKLALASGGSSEALKVLSRERNSLPPKLNARLALNRAQLAYDRAQWGQVFDELNLIPRNSTAWHAGQNVGAWTAFRRRDLNLTLGTLMTLNSPFLVGKFSPESRVLEAAALFELCQYPSASKSIEIFMSQYKNLGAVIQRFDRAYGRSLKGVAFVFNYARGAQTAPRGYTQKSWDLLMDALLSQDEFLRADQVLSSAHQEAIAWSRLGVKGSSLGRALRTEMIKKLSVFENEALKMGLKPLRLGLHRAQQLTRDSLESALIIELEVNTRLRDRLVQGRSGVERDVEIDAQLAAGYEFWPFQNEYWRDETANYMFSTTDVCEGT